MNNIRINIGHIKARIQHASLTSGRNPEEVKLLLAVKTVPAETIALALSGEKTLLGENKVQELKSKYDYLAGRNAEFHFIGHLQTNKIKDVLKYADCLQSVDRRDLVQKLDQRLQHEGRHLDIFMQVNTSYEKSKFGVSPEEAIALAKEIAKYDTLNVKGLMTIGLFSAETEKVRRCFRLLKQKQLEIQELGLSNFDLRELSMGMSYDFETAIEEGATIVRVGTAIFGDRIYPDSYYWNEKKERNKMKKLRIHYLQHVPFEGPGCIKEWALEKQHELTSTKLYEKENFPALEDIDWLIIMGGPMSVNDGDTISWVNPEKEYISQAIKAGKTVIGICLGSQFIASALGAAVYANKNKEIGWFPVFSPIGGNNLLFQDAQEFAVFHWHGETFDLPEGSTLLASSEACINQAYLYGENILGLQFHFEVTQDSLEQMLTFGKEDIDGTQYTQTAEYIAAQKQLIAENNERLYRILNHFESK